MSEVLSNNADVAHTWASQAQDYGRTSNHNFYFSGATIYSYGSHFPIATFHGPRFVLFTSDTYSNTTAKHKSLTLRAVSHCEVIEVDNVEPQTTKDHRANVAGIARELRQLAGQWKRSRSYKDMLRGQIYSRVRDIEKYLDHFGLKPLKATRELLARFVPAEDLNADNDTDFIGYLLDLSEIESKRLQAKQKREAKKRAKAEAERREREAEARKVAERKAREHLPLWRENGGTFANLHLLPVALRIKAICDTGPFIDRHIVQTSHGAEITGDDFARAYRLWKRSELKIGDRVGHFRFDGNAEKCDCVQIGCHCIPTREIENVARLFDLRVVV